MARSESPSAFAQAIAGRDGVMREKPAIDSEPAGQAEGYRRQEPRAVIWRIAGARNRRTHAGWADAAVIVAERRKSVRWLFLLRSLGRSGRFLSSSLGLRRSNRDDLR